MSRQYNTLLLSTAVRLRYLESRLHAIALRPLFINFMLLQTIEAIVKEVGSSGKVVLRLSPYSWDFNECYELEGVEATIALNVHLLKELNKFNLAYVHIISARIGGAASIVLPFPLPFL